MMHNSRMSNQRHSRTHITLEKAIVNADGMVIDTSPLGRKRALGHEQNARHTPSHKKETTNAQEPHVQSKA